MAERRMFTKKVTDDDNFMALSSSAQALYLHLSMSADDDGFCNQVSLSMFKAHASVQDLEALLEKRYIYQFENGVIVIKHWRMANALRKDRYTPTAFQEELKMLNIKENGSYSLEKSGWLPDGCQMVAVGKDSIDKLSIGKESKGKKNKTQKTMDLFFELLTSDEFIYSNINTNQELKDSVMNWLTYKEEKKQGYKQTGLKSLLKQIEKKSVEHGIYKVIDAIERTMSAGYQGIGWYYIDNKKYDSKTVTDWDSV